MENQTQSIYHYTNVDSLFKILDTLTLKFGTFEKVNDPKESKSWPFKFFCIKSQSKGSFDPGLFKKINSFILKRSKVLCLSTDNEIVSQEGDDFFTNGYSYPRMWSQYANNSTGACLIFDKAEMQCEFEKAFAGLTKFSDSIEYINSAYGPKLTEHGFPVDPYGIFFEQFIQVGLESYLSEHINKYNKYLYFFKHSNWRDENEFRFVILDKEEDNERYFPISSSLKAILITDDFPEDKLPNLLLMCTKMNIKLERLIWRGWAGHRLPFLDPENPLQQTISFNGISYLTHFNYETLYMQACDHNGKMRTLLFDFKDDVRVKLID